MKTSFLGRGKFKLVLFLTLCAVVLGCALFAFIGISTYTQAQKNLATDTEFASEIAAPEKESTSTATTRIAMPTISDLGQAAGSTFYKGDDYSLSSDGRTATISYAKYFPGFAPFLISVSNYNSTYMTCVVSSDITSSDGGGSSWLSWMSSSATYTLKSGYAWSNGTTSPITLSLDVTPIDMSEMEITGINSNYTYTGSPITPSPTVRYKYRDDSMLDGYDYEDLSEGSDYELSYLNSTKEGTATVTIKGINEYYGGTVTCNYTIRRISVAMPIFTGIDAEYNGFSEDDIKSVEGEYYTLSSDKRDIYMSFDIFVKFNGYSTLPPLKAYISNYNASYMTSSISSTGDINGADQSTYIQLFGIGTTTITYTLKTGYKWSDGSLTPLTLTLTVDPIDIADVDISGINSSYTYTGSPISPTLNLTYNYPDYYNGALQNPTEEHYDLTDGTDYRYYYTNNKEEGTATVTIEGMGEYGGTVTRTFTIRRISVSMPIFTGIEGAGGWSEEDLSHDGAFYTLSSNKRDISMNYDMFVKFNGYSNIPPFSAQIGNYSASCMTYSASGTGANSGSGHGGADHLWSFGVGTVSVTYTLKTGYRWSDGSLDPITLTFTVDPIDISDVDISGINANYTYTGSPITPTPSLRYNYIDYNHHGDVNNPYEDYYDLTKDTDYTVSYNNNTNVGTATVTITGIGNYTGTVEETFTIIAKFISGATIADIANQTYTGNEIKPAPTVTLTGFTPTYSVTYSNNVNVGTATITVTGTGNFSGTATKTFIIDKADIPSLGFSYSTVTYGADSAAPTVTGNVGNGVLSYTVANGTGTATINAQTGVITPTQAGDVIVTLSVAASSNYNGCSKTITVTIEKATLSLGLSYPTVTYGTDSAEPTVTGNVGNGVLSYTVANGTGTATINAQTGVITPSQAGTVEVGVMVDATTNYTVGSKTITVTIAPRDISNASFGAIGAINYDGFKKEPTPEITDNAINKTLTDGTDFTFSYLNNIDAGSATITITGKGNYTGTKSTSFTINGRNVEDATVGTLDSYIYDGTEKKPTATVTFGSTTLISGMDFEFSYSSNINAGKGKLIITGKGNYSGTKEVEFTISARNLSNAAIADLPSQEYNGVAKTPALTLTDLGKTLVLDTDYTVSYKDNTNAGTATVTITGTGNYTGERTRSFTITARSISGVTVSAISPYTYDGTAKEPKPTVTDGSNTLTEGVDYTLSYRDNVNVGTATLILTGMGNYTGTKEVGFSIQPPSLDGATVTLSETSFTYDGTAKEPRVTSVEVDGVTLRAGTDYTVSYTNNINAGTAKVVITGAGDYVGTTEVTFTINPADIANASVSGLQITYTYTGAAISPEITVTFGGNTLVKNTDYLVSYSDNTDVGTATVTVTGSRNFTGTLTDNFTIIRADIASATVTGVNATYAYTTTAITPEPTVNWNGILLVKDTDYTLSYSDNVELGTATITVAGLGNFSGTVTKTFEIVQADITPSTVTGINVTYTFTGSDIEPTVTVVLNGVTLTLDTDYTVAYADNLNVGTATVTITGCGNYTGTVTKNFDIEEADMDDVTVTGIDATYEYTGSAIEPEPAVTANGITLVKDTDYTVAYADNTDLGTATITITGLGNFKAVKTVTFEIVAADIANATVTGVDEEYEYTGSAIAPEPTVTLNGVTLDKDADYSLSYINNTDLGEAVINITGIGNYTGLKSTGFRIVEADADGATVTGIDEEYPWTGSAITPEPAVTLNGVTLVKDTDFTVVYTDNTEIGTATYAITFIGNYTGSAGGTFEIIKATPDVEITLDYDGVSPLFVGKALPAISAVATYNGATVAGTVSWDTDGGSAPTLKENENAYAWTFTPDDTDHYEAVTGSETLTAQRPQYIAIRAEWKNGAQPALFTSTSITVVKQNLKVTGIFSDGATDEIIGGYSFVINGADGSVYTSMPTVGGNDFSITVTFGDIPPCTDLVGVEIQDVALSGLVVTPADGGDITTDYIALDKFDTASVKVTANYNDGTEKTLEFGRGGYSVIYAQGTDYLQFEDTKVTLSFTDNGVTKTVDVEGLNIVKKVFDRSSLSFNPADRNYAFGSSVTGDIKVENMPSWLQVTYKYEDAEGNLIDASDVKNAGTYKVTAKFTVNKNYEDIEDMTATFRVTPVEPALTPAVGGSLAEGTALKDLTITVNDGATTGTLTWDDVAYKLKAGVNRCYYTFTPDDTVNFKVVHGYVDIMADVPTPETVTGETLGGWQIALIVVSVAVAVLALIALIAALKSRRMAVDADGFYDDASPEDMN